MRKQNPARKKNNNVLIGICGSIAAYKTCELVRELVRRDIRVKCVLTESAEKFITPLTLQTLSADRVYRSMFDEEYSYDPGHLSLAGWADVIVISPATANTIARIASGFADDLLTSVVLSAVCPVLICPAMNSNMWLNPVTQENVQTLIKRGYRFLGPEEGALACRENGIGRLVPTGKITGRIISILAGK
ncbi:MAG: phosphopantothenoylcysteine decarboxylase [Elusimicrobia bacterium]|nr:phosphopantothenoylcysteine decarboxylase [Elusimicrobiota bacterium]